LVDGEGVIPDSDREAFFWFLVIPLVSIVASSYLFTYNPNIAWAISDVIDGSSSRDFARGQALEISRGERDYLNRQYVELNTRLGDGVGENAYCMYLEDDGSISFQMAGTVEADENTVSSTLSNCREGIIGLHHFHPQDGRPILSSSYSVGESNDKQTFLSTEAFDVMCVQSKTIRAGVGETADNMRCYSKRGVEGVDDEFPEIRVRVTQ